MMGYTEEEARRITITRKQAYIEIKQHDLSVADFVEDVGSKDVYTGLEVLNWLGY